VKAPDLIRGIRGGPALREENPCTRSGSYHLQGNLFGCWWHQRTCRLPCAMSAPGDKAENICSHWTFPVWTRKGHQGGM